MTTPATSVRVDAEDLTRLIAATFAAVGADAAEAERIARNLTEANLAGHDSHGVVRTPRYVGYARDGVLHFGGSVAIAADGGAFLLLEGGMGFGQTLGAQAVEIGVARARAQGVSVVALRNAGHLGRIGAWAEMALAEGLVSIHFVNVGGSVLVAPFGGAERRLSTAPVTIGVPNPGGDDFVLDFATSRIAEGKALIAQQGGKPAPMGGLIDAEGRPTADPAALYGPVAAGETPDPRKGPGALAPMGEHKGSGLAIACELLAGALTGSGATGPGGDVHNGMLSIYIDPDRLDDGHGWAAEVARYIDYLRSARPADPAAPVMIPGDPERKARAERLADGVPLSAEVWGLLTDAARAAGVPAADIPAPRGASE